MDPAKPTTISPLTRTALTAPLLLALAATTACGDDHDDKRLEARAEPLVAACVEADETLPSEAWVCGTDLTVECSRAAGSHPGAIYVDLADLPDADAETTTCADADLTLSDEGPFGPGTYEIEVDSAIVATEAPVCISALTVVDTTPPSVESETFEVWPPNHELVDVHIDDCVIATDACDADLDVAFVWASSSETRDATGDGSTETDVLLTRDRVQIRAERAGSGDGRVYALGWIAVDEVGNHTEGTCYAVVPHDQGDTTEAPSEDAAYAVVLPDPIEVGSVQVYAELDGTDAILDVDRTLTATAEPMIDE